MHIMQYISAQDLQSAWEANQKKGSVILGGCCWLRLSQQRNYRQAVDISALGLDTIEERDHEFVLGAMVTLRQIELSAPLNDDTQGAWKEAVRHIVGTQFRNLATIGGSVCGRFGFSDILTLLMALDAAVVLYKGGRMAIKDFAEVGAGQDILTHVIIPKKTRRTDYASLRLNTTDFPIIACAVAVTDTAVYCAIGARPLRAQVQVVPKADVVAKGIEATAQALAEGVSYGDNTRGSAEYRHDMAIVLCKRLLSQTMEAKACYK